MVFPSFRLIVTEEEEIEEERCRYESESDQRRIIPGLEIDDEGGISPGSNQAQQEGGDQDLRILHPEEEEIEDGGLEEPRACDE